jgi:hypothetical protein
MQIFEDLFRDSPEDISRSDLAFYVQYAVPDITRDVLLRFESHAFFSPGRDVRARFESLRVYFIARWLANRLEEAIAKPVSDSAIAELLERSASGCHQSRSPNGPGAFEIRGSDQRTLSLGASFSAPYGKL